MAVYCILKGLEVVLGEVVLRDVHHAAVFFLGGRGRDSGLVQLRETTEFSVVEELENVVDGDWLELHVNILHLQVDLLVHILILRTFPLGH